MQKYEIGTKHIIDRTGDEIGILEEKPRNNTLKASPTNSTALDRPREPSFLVQPQQNRRQGVVDDDRRTDDQDVDRPPPPVKHQGYQNKPQDRPLAMRRAEQNKIQEELPEEKRKGILAN